VEGTSFESPLGAKRHSLPSEDGGVLALPRSLQFRIRPPQSPIRTYGLRASARRFNQVHSAPFGFGVSATLVDARVPLQRGRDRSAAQCNQYRSGCSGTNITRRRCPADVLFSDFAWHRGVEPGGGDQPMRVRECRCRFPVSHRAHSLRRRFAGLQRW
jgi:hypothetical protein